MVYILTSFFLCIYNTRPLIISNINPANLSSWNPPRPDILYTALGTRPIYRTLLLESAQSRDIQHKIHTQQAPFLPPSSAQVHPVRAQELLLSRLATSHAPRLLYGSAPFTPRSHPRAQEQEAKKELTLFRTKRLK
jgi:hypothetical protein